MKDGKVVALKVEHYSNAGNTMDLSQSVSMGTPASWGWGYHSNAGNTIDLGVSMGTAASRGWGVPGKSRAGPTATLARASSVPACYHDGSLPIGPHPRVLHPWLISKTQR